jgi:cytochrome c oxidase accessory protein FixG
MNDLEKVYQEEESFRNSLATVDKTGKRIWIYPKKPRGPLFNARKWVSYILLLFLFGAPFIKLNGEPLLLFNVLEAKFVIFGIIFTPQDIHLFALGMVTLMVFIVLFTVVYGRLFCGWVCPQTIFMEMVFRRIEYLIEGDANQQRKLDKDPWTPSKIFKKGLKHAIFFTLAVIVANIFLSYIIGADQVLKIINDPISQHLGGFIAMLIFSGLFYGVFAFLREQVCTTICPYGRLQGVLLVPESIVVAYDFVRGEPRGKIRRNMKPEEFSSMGDCIDCKLCIQVCPTGIDIRNGTQLECVNCTACIDACDEVMEKVEKPKKLIRYDSLKGIQEGKRKVLTPRVLGYTGVLLALIVLQAFLFTTRTTVEAIILRTPGQLFQKVNDNTLSNLYNWEVINKTSHDIPMIKFKVIGKTANIRMVGAPDSTIARKQGLAKGIMFIDLPLKEVEGHKTKLKIEVYSGDKLIDKTTTNFLGPIM